MGKNERPLPTQDDIVNGLYNDFDIEPYTVKRDDVVQSRLTEFAAIDLINTYCTTLLTSKFVYLVPIWKLDKDDSKDMYRVLHLFFII